MLHNFTRIFLEFFRSSVLHFLVNDVVCKGLGMGAIYPR